MRLLILGGTVFLGRHLVPAALARGHQVTLFNRGQSNPGLFPQTARLRGDRDGGLDALAAGRWDAVIDTSGYVPRLVDASAGILAGRVSHYTFISSISVYASFATPGQDERAPVGRLADPSTETINGESYGPLKALCEEAVQARFPHGALIIRPGLIVGPYDPTDRFSYWVHRLAQGGEVLAPGGPELPVQLIDARDLAQWTVRLVEERVTGTFNATGPDYRLTLGQVMESGCAVSGSDARLVWLPEPFLLEQEVAPWSEMPLWVPQGTGEYDGFANVSVARAMAAGLTFRPLAQTVAQTLAWLGSRPADHRWRAGISPARESELLQRWQQQQA